MKNTICFRIIRNFTEFYQNYAGIPVFEMVEFSCKIFLKRNSCRTESEQEIPAILELPASRKVKPSKYIYRHPLTHTDTDRNTHTHTNRDQHKHTKRSRFTHKNTQTDTQTYKERRTNTYTHK